MPNPTEVLAATGDGLIAIVKRDCPTCELAGPVLATLQQAGRLDVYSQDDPSFHEQLAKLEADKPAEVGAAVSEKKKQKKQKKDKKDKKGKEEQSADTEAKSGK